MKNFLLILSFASITLCSCKNNAEGEAATGNGQGQEVAYKSYGEDFKLNQSLTAAEMEERFQNMKPGDTAEVTLKATVNSVCKNKGCWMTLDLPEDNEDVMVKFKDYGFFVPKDIEQKDVVVRGKAYVTEVSVDEQRHYAEDKGETAEAVAAITEPKRTLSFLADGVLIEE
ncbi:DUF4920 domain-containing protein [Antarcticibacterium sp. 1MA-6-2]|uniref:DUF4920 domain-containing protein n=1 Tax=Antarcticibacterium sp. 1MA-6-2 TaxID=2908210 RepID=UPI001F255153|nr:DUF4920 domain-containing protein [Antarcticibacterium sp. 1MA-6-2]UJH92585.1 DUF4920 domain-containing protein [Antarcticibacterium sp. 1MA-6-2]